MRKFTTEAPKQATIDPNSLPIDRDVAVYYRQSTDGQFGNSSTYLQCEDLPALALAWGWQPSQIHLLDRDAGVSGTIPLVERESGQALFDLVVSGQVGSVLLATVSRLSRDGWLIDGLRFGQICRDHRVMIIVPSGEDGLTPDPYNFHGPRGREDFQRYKQQLEFSAEYLENHVRGVLHANKRRLAKQGKWTNGGSLPLGYVITTGGSPKDANYHQLIPFSPLADVVREYVELLVRFGGSLAETRRHIQQNGPFLPTREYLEERVPEGQKLILNYRYTPGVPGDGLLKDLATNPIRIGCWLDGDRIVAFDHHAPILDKGLFQAAFSLFSDTNLDGTPNAHYSQAKMRAKQAQFEAPQPRNVSEPLFRGLIKSYLSPGKFRFAWVTWQKDRYWYRVRRGVFWQKGADEIDQFVISALKERIDLTSAQNIVQQVEQNNRDREVAIRRNQARLASTEQIKQEIADSFPHAVGIPGLIDNLRERYLRCESEIVAIRAELAVLHEQDQQDQHIAELRDHLDDLSKVWTRNEIQEAARLTIQEITAQPEDGGLLVSIVWKGKIPITMPDGTEVDVEETSSVLFTLGSNFTESDFKWLSFAVDQKTTQIEILEHFPHLTWRQIRRAWGHYAQEHGLNPRLSVERRVRQDDTFYSVCQKRGLNPEIPIKCQDDTLNPVSRQAIQSTIGANQGSYKKSLACSTCGKPKPLNLVSLLPFITFPLRKAA